MVVNVVSSGFFKYLCMGVIGYRVLGESTFFLLMSLWLVCYTQWFHALGHPCLASLLFMASLYSTFSKRRFFNCIICGVQQLCSSHMTKFVTEAVAALSYLDVWECSCRRAFFHSCMWMNSVKTKTP